MKRTLATLVVLVGLGTALMGCADSYGGSPAGAEAGQKKEYTTEDAAAAVPKRGGSETE